MHRSLTAVTVLAAATFAHADHIDLFDVGDFQLAADTGMAIQTQTQVGLDSASVLGGTRGVSLIYLNGVTSKALDLEASLVADAGSLFFSADRTVRGSLVLTYGGTTDLNANFSRDDYSGVVVDIAGDLPAQLTLTLDGQTLTQSFDGGAATVYFDTAGLAGLGDVDTVSLRVEGVTDGDYEIDSVVRLVPSPTAFGAGALLLVGVAGGRLRG